jgi:hydroxypyruvate reductase
VYTIIFYGNFMNLVNNPLTQNLLADQPPADRRRREDALRILGAALDAVDPFKAVLNALKLEGNLLKLGSREYDLNNYYKIYVVGAGKAGAPMAGAVAQVLGEKLSGGAVNVKYAHLAGAPRNVATTESGHPIPDENGVQGARRMLELLSTADEKTLVLAVISGGASALLELPVEGVSLADMQALTGLLLKAGATINQLNTVRKHLSQVKGGNLARHAYPATLVSLILSDVVGSPLDVIGSGPTVPDTSTFAQAWAVLEQYGLAKPDIIPTAIYEHLRKGLKGEIPDTPKQDDPAFANTCNLIVGDNRVAALAASEKARELGYNPLILSTFIEGEAREVARVLAGIAKEIATNDTPVAKPACLIAGGETTVTIKGNGTGGRNQEMALALALSLEGWPDIVAVPLATDGTDGPTDAAGAIVDGQSAAIARQKGLDPQKYLENNNSYDFFTITGDHLKTGPTSTNVNDLAIVLVC